MERNIKITKLDYLRLNNLIASSRKEKTIELKNINVLEYELIRAEKVISEKIDPDFITMNSVIKIYNHNTGKEMTIKIVFPQDADYKKNFICYISYTDDCSCCNFCIYLLFFNKSN